MPDHAGLPILILKNKFEFLARLRVISFGKQGMNDDHAVAGKKPIMLRTPGLSGRAKSSDQAATQVGVAHPGLAKSDFRPDKRTIEQLRVQFPAGPGYVEKTVTLSW